MWNIGEYRKRSQRLADHLPWAVLIGPGVVLNKDGSLEKTVRFRGPDLDSSTPYELVAARARMNNVLRRLGSHWCVHVEAARRSAHAYPGSEFPNPVAELIDRERRQDFTSEALHFESQCFVTFTYLPPAESMARLSDLFIERPSNGSNGQVSYRAHYDHFLGQVDQVVNLMASFMPEVQPLDDSETLTYLHSCISDRRLTIAVPSLMALGGVDSHVRGDAPLPGMDAGVGGFGIPQAGVVVENQQRDKEAFLSQAAAVEPYLAKPLLDPISKYELKAGSVIPGALVTAINTDLPGEVIGQVTENVFDSVSGEYLLIPQGSKLLGKYQSLISNGQNRALVVWQRLIYPNGQSIVLDGMPGTDEAGQSGLQDQVDYHLDKLPAGAAFSTALAYAGNLARNPNSSSGNNGQDVVGDTVAQEANRIGEKIIDRELDVQPTITIRQGWPLRVLVNKDMVLAPYQP